MSRRLCWVCTLAGVLAAFSLIEWLPKRSPIVWAKEKKIRVLCWSERTEPADVYPDGINGALAAMINKEKDLSAKVANLSDPGQGLTEEALSNTDVLIWFGHQKHAELTAENIDRVVEQIQERGLGYMPIHSAHYAKPFQKILTSIAAEKNYTFTGPPGKWGLVRNEGKPELIHILTPGHPIVKGVSDFTIPKTETYNNPFNSPPPDVKILEGKYQGGQQDGNEGLLWQFGKGKVFYLQAGHETYPIYFQAEVQQIIRNAIRYLASPEPVKRSD